MKKILILLMLISNLLSGQEYFKNKKFSTKIYPISVAVDKDENVYIADRLTYSIKKYNKKGKYLFSFGIKSKKINLKEKIENPDHNYPTPVDIFVKDDKFYLLDINNGILIFDLDGEFQKRIIYKKGELLGETKNPKSIYVGDRIILSDTVNNRIQLFTLDGKMIKDFGYDGVYPGALHRPEGISVLNGKIIVADTGNNRISVFDKNGIHEQELIIPKRKYKSPGDIYVNNGMIYITNVGNNSIEVFDNKFNIFMSFGKSGMKNTEFNGIEDIWVTDNYIYVADNLNKCVKVFDKNINFIRSFGKNNLINQFLWISMIGILSIIILVMIFHRTRKEKISKPKNLNKDNIKKAEEKNIKK